MTPGRFVRPSKRSHPLHTTLFSFVILIVSLSLVGCTNQAADQSHIDAVAHQPGIVLLRYSRGSASTEQRELGFLETLEKEAPQIHILSSSEYAGTTPESAKAAAGRILEHYGDAVQGIFAVCEPNTDGVLRALEEAKKTNKIKFIGFDPNPVVVAALSERKIDGVILQDPVQMGYIAVRTMIKHLNGETIPRAISTGEYIATPDNLDDQSLQPLLRPQQFSGKHSEPIELKHTIAVITKGRTHSFWESVRQGAETAATEAGDVTIEFKAPMLESDLEGQIKIIEKFIEDKVSGICLVPIDAVRQVEVVKKAKQQGVPVLIFDSDLHDDDQLKISYVATDNYEAGALAARRLAEVVGASKTQVTRQQ